MQIYFTQEYYILNNSNQFQNLNFLKSVSYKTNFNLSKNEEIIF